MSRATRQAILILSFVNGAIKLIIQEEDSLPHEIAPTVFWADTFSREIIDRYPETGDNRKNVKWMKENLKRWADMGADKMIRWHPAVVSTMALNFIEDILDKIQNQARADLETLRDGLIRISYFYTDRAEGDLGQYFDEASAMADELYAVIDFSR